MLRQRPQGVRRSARAAALLVACGAGLLHTGSRSWVPTLTGQRRAAVTAAILGCVLPSLDSQPADAFPNQLYESDVPANKKKPGKYPSGLGAYPRKEGQLPDLNGCGKAPNCFSSAATSEFNTFKFAPEIEEAHQLEPWRYTGASKAEAFADVEKVVRAYPVGQKGIDVGGFQVKKADGEKGYLYAQFESGRLGYIDDVEFLVRPDGGDGQAGELRVRSASRQGFLDFGVNAKRLNRIAEDLSKLPGGRWKAQQLTNERYPSYIAQNR
mmetsp:Transcript_14304/g.42675  ORF Transcript_14304/g.42675 Transcript_14304/m.42675 type:complete len:268 (-) Transcript_14304:59-862(-)